MPENYQHKLRRAERFFQSKVSGNFSPKTAIVLGSGLGELFKKSGSFLSLPYRKVPGFSVPTTPGHSGEVLVGSLEGKDVLVFSGRVHYYEGYSPEEITFPVRLAAKLGVRSLILTAQVGSMNLIFKPGDFVIVKDHLNFMGINPLRGAHDPAFGERFPDCSECYAKDLQRTALLAAKKNRITAHSGNYFAVSGPSYETPAEVRAFKNLGGDVVGMSVVPEAVAAHQMGLKVLGICVVSNVAAGLMKKTLSHEEVLKVGKQVSSKLSGLIQSLIREI